MPYRFDILLSYPRRSIVTNWLNHFEPLFTDWLHEELIRQNHQFANGQASIFRDDQIEAGQDWPTALREAARDSRCALAILLPSYDASPYCRAEWETFRLRGPELIIPVRFHDCEERREQIFDLSDYTSTKKSARKAEKFHSEIKTLAKQAANRIVSAPPYPENPETESWIAFKIPEPPPGRPILQARL